LGIQSTWILNLKSVLGPIHGPAPPSYLSFYAPPSSFLIPTGGLFGQNDFLDLPSGRCHPQEASGVECGDSSSGLTWRVFSSDGRPAGEFPPLPCSCLNPPTNSQRATLFPLFHKRGYEKGGTSPRSPTSRARGHADALPQSPFNPSLSISLPCLPSNPDGADRSSGKLDRTQFHSRFSPLDTPLIHGPLPLSSVRPYSADQRCAPKKSIMTIYFELFL